MEGVLFLEKKPKAYITHVMKKAVLSIQKLLFNDFNN